MNQYSKICIPSAHRDVTKFKLIPLYQTVLIFLNFSVVAQDSQINTIQDIDWSPDGQYIFFSAMWHKPDYSDYKPENWSIYKSDIRSQHTTKIIESALYVSTSPDGEKLAVGKNFNGNRDIYIFDYFGIEIERVTSHPADDFAPDWSPEGRQIIFNSRRTGSTEIYLTNSRGNWIRQLSSGYPNSSYNPQWSPDGKQLVYYLEMGDSKDQIYVIQADGSRMRNISTNDLLNYFPSWIDSENILYTCDRGEQEAVIIHHHLDSNDSMQLLGIGSYYAKASPAGDMIAYIDTDDRTIVVVNSEGESMTKLILTAPDPDE